MATNANANGIPFLKSKRLGIPDPIKDSMVVWYDIKRQGATNESMSQNPILKDLSGHGHDATCYNFAWNRQSGISSYFDFNLFKYGSNWGKYVKDVTETSFIYYHPGNDNSVMVNANNYVVYPFQIKVTGITDTGLRLEYGQGTIPETESSIKTDGVYTITRTAYGGFKLYGDESITCNIKIEQIAYPNALVSDGVDDYAYVEGLPLLTDCTAFIMRDLIDIKRDSITVVKGRIGSSVNGYSIIVDRIDLEVSMPSYNFLTRSIFSNSWLKDKLIIGSPTFINGWENNLDRINDEFDLLHLLGEPYSQHYAKAALYSFILFDRTLTDEEIEWVKANLIK